MDEEDEKKQQKKSLGETLGSLVRTVKHLFNPIILWTVIIAFFLIIIVGYVSYFISIPSQILGQMNKWLEKLGHIDVNGSGKITATSKELIELCNYLEEMGYDLEGYGFVKKGDIKRASTVTYESSDSSKTPANGEITEVKSKYLEAYIISEKKIYAISNPSVKGEEVLNEATVYIPTLADLIIEKWFAVNQNNKETFEDYADKFIEYRKNNFNWDMVLDRDNLKHGVGLYYYLGVFKGYDVSYAKQLCLNFSPDEFFAYNNADNFIQWLWLNTGSSQFEDTMGTEIRAIIPEAESEMAEYKYVGDGLIFLENNKSSYFAQDGNWVVGDSGKDHYVDIDEGNKLFKITTPIPADSPILNVLGINDLSTYAYDLNNWTTKYGKPQEFLISVHSATMAPDFAYKLATSGAVDTKVHVSLFDTNINLTVVTGDKSNESVKEIINSANTDSRIVDELKQEVYNAIEKMQNPSSLAGVTQAIKDYYYSVGATVGEILSQLVGMDYDPPYSDIIELPNRQDVSPTEEQIGKWAIKVCRVSLENEFDKLESVSEIIDKVQAIYEVKNLDLKLEEKSTSSLNITDDKYSIISNLPFGDYAAAIQAITDLEKPVDVATPYITKVVRHWYRNQYFTNVGGDTDYAKKTRLNELVYNYYNILLNDQLANYTDDDIYNYYGGIVDLDLYNTIEQMKVIQTKVSEKTEDELNDNNLVTQIRDDLEKSADKIGLNITDTQKELIENEFTGIEKQFANEDFNGGAYKIESNPEPYWVAISELDRKSNDGITKPIADTNKNVAQFIGTLTIKESRSADIVQIHNPLFEDNSQYIRSWLKEKYKIYNGKTDKSNVNGNNATDQAGEEKYIQGKTALQAIKTQLEECSNVRTDMVYMLRDLKELFQDFEFDIENREVPASKVLTNIMPAYEPYTPWPSIYEKSESNCTKIIYKGESTTLEAPENCIIRKAGNGIIDLEFVGDDQDNASIMGMTMRVKIETGSLDPTVSVDPTVSGANSTNNLKNSEEEDSKVEKNVIQKGQKIANVSPSEGKIVLKLYLFTATKQTTRVEDYMEIKSKGYDDLSDNEKICLYRLLDAEIDKKDETSVYTVANDMINVVLNRIASPYYSEKSIEDAIGNGTNAENIGFAKLAEKNSTQTDVATLEENLYLKSAITSALKGTDFTKSDTLLGATSYFSSNNANEIEKKKDEYKSSILLENSTSNENEKQYYIFGITKEEYYEYVKYVLENKINEAIYELDIGKYVIGIEESKLGYENVEEVAEENREKIYTLYKGVIENTLKPYYIAGTFIDDCGGIKFKDPDATITSLVKSNVYQELEEDGNNTKVIDHITLTANANYIVKWEFTYEIGQEGKIVSDEIKVEHTAVINY